MVSALFPFTVWATAFPAWSPEVTLNLEQLHREEVIGPLTESLRINYIYIKYRSHNAPRIHGLPYINFYIIKSNFFCLRHEFRVL
jgi:hypothetical protein